MTTCQEKARDNSFWAAALVLSLALCLWGYFHPYARLGFSLLPVLLCANYKTLVAEWKIGVPRWIMIPWLLMLIFATAHLVYGKSLTDAMGLLLVLLGLGVYLLARTMPDEIRKWLAALSILGSLALIVSRIADSVTPFPGILGIFHSATFAILIGIVFAPKELKLWTTILGFTALLISGSEEGIVAAMILIGYIVLSKRMTKQVAIVLVLMILTAIPLVASGWMTSVYPRLIHNRFHLDMETLSHSRWSAYIDLATQPSIWVAGAGWYWNTIGSWEAKVMQYEDMWQTTHNTPLRIASQLGIISALAWLSIFLTALYKLQRNRAAFLVILTYAMLDHFMWGSAIAWCWVILGVAYAMEIGSSVDSIASPVSDSADRRLVGTVASSDAAICSA